MKTSDIITVHPGKQHNLEQTEQLVQYFDSVKHITSIAFSRERISKLSFAPTTVISELEKRSLNHAAFSHVDTYPWLELIYKWKSLTKQRLSNKYFKRRNFLFQKYVIKKYAPPKIFIGFDTSSEYIFEKWKGKAILILDLTIAVPQYKRSLASIYALSKANIENLVAGDEVWYNTYQKEIELADFILCGSEFVKESCLHLGAKAEKLKVIPYGANLRKFIPLKEPAARSDKPIKIAFVGNVSHRKGADVLLRAWEKLAEKFEHIELHFFGNILIDTKEYRLTRTFFHGFIIQSDLINELSDAHISILPTFFEGSSYAIYQSMALGLAVVTTPNCGSVIKDGETGILIQYGSEQEIINTLSNLIENKELRLSLSYAAIADVQKFTWDSYGANLKEFITTLKC